MQKFKAQIFLDDKLILDDFICWVHIDDEPGKLKSWFGSFEVPVDADIVFMPNYILKLSDGRKGEIFFTKSRGNEINFRGTGPLE